jgi:hypothetical protein
MKRAMLLFCLLLLCFKLMAPAGVASLSIISGEAIIDRDILNLRNVLYVIEKIGIREPDIVYAQILLETGYLTSDLCIKYNNLCGMKYPRIRKTKAVGRFKSMSVYRTWQESIEDYKIYQDLYYKGGDYYQFLNGRYAEDPNYIKKLKEL